jgi:hypothetical protein
MEGSSYFSSGTKEESPKNKTASLQLRIECRTFSVRNNNTN